MVHIDQLKKILFAGLILISFYGVTEAAPTIINTPPNLVISGDTTLFLCQPSEVCITLHGDDDDDDHLTLSLLSGGGNFPTILSDTTIDSVHCFIPDTSGVYCFIFELDDDAFMRGLVENDKDVDTVCITVILNSSPTVISPTNQSMFVCDLSQICLPGFSYSDADSNIVSVTVTGGMLSGDTVCFTPVEGLNTISLSVTDSCGAVTTSTTEVNVTLNSQPITSSPANLSIFVCDLSPICLSGFSYSDIDNNISSVSVSNGTLSGDTVCFTPSVGFNTVTLTVTDSCGLVSTSTTEVIVTFNSGPSATSPANSSIFVCDLSPICLPGFTSTDVDNNLASVVVSNGTLSGDTVCFTPVAGLNTITLTVTDSCGVVSTSTTNITTTVNSGPTATSPSDANMFVCDLSTICLLGFSYSDADNNIASVTVSNGVLSGDTVCFTPVAGLNTITLTVTDSCGVVSTSATNITVTVNAGPTATSPADVNMFVCDLSTICLPGFSYADADNNIASVTVSNGTLSGDTVCFIPTMGVNSITLTVTDSCGVVSSSTTNITTTVNAGPTATSPPDANMFVCDLSTICLPGFSYADADNNIASVTVSNGILSGDTVCFTPVAGLNTITLTVTDSCGLTATSTTVITIAENNGPTATSPADANLFVCDLSTICLPGFSFADADNNIASVTVSNGTLSGDTVCFTPVAGLNTITLTATDSCGVVSTSATNITVTVNSGPTATSPADVNMFVCDLSTICLPGFSYADADNNIASVTVSNGTLSGDTVCFTPVAGLNTITLTVTDSCGVVSTSTTNITITVNAGPTAVSPADANMFVCDLSTICLPGFSYADADNNIASVVVSNGTLSGDTVCFIPTIGVNTITLIVTDSCGLTATSTTVITIAENNGPTATSPADANMFVCDLSTICLPGFSYADADNNIASVTVSNGTLLGDTVCFTPVAGLNTITLTVTDSCGVTTSTTTNVTVTLNNEPTATSPADLSMFVCDLSTICLPGFSYADSDNNIASITVSNGTLLGDTVCFTPVAGLNTITLTVSDSCGVTATSTTNITVTVNAGPTAVSPAGLSMFVCDLSTICLPGFSFADADNNIASVTVSNGTLSGDTVCFTPVAGLNTITFSVTDSCGVTASSTTTITIDLATPPVINDTTISTFICSPGDICVPLPAVLGGRAPYSYFVDGRAVADTVCAFFSTDTMLNITVIVVDSCSHTDTAIVTVNAMVNHKPILSIVGPTNAFLCSSGDTVVVKMSIVDPDDGISCVSTLGSCNLSDSTVYFIADTAGTYCGDVVVTDSCGLADTTSFCVGVTINSDPTATSPANSSLFVCDLSDICLPGFSFADADNNIASVTVSNGTLSGDTVCITPTAGLNTITLTVTDSCGSVATSTTTITVTLNSAPVTNSPANENRSVCDLSQICIPGFNATDADGNLQSVILTGGTLTGSTACFTPIAGLNRLIFIATDSCGIADTSITEITITVTSPPTVTCANDTLIEVDALPTSMICVSGFSCSDPDSDIVSSTISYGTLSGSTVCFTPDTAGTYTFAYTCEDACGNVSVCTTSVIVSLISNGPGIIIETAQNQQIGRFASVKISFNNPTGAGFARANGNTGSSFDVGGYDFLLKYDKSALLFSGATQGQFLDACEWEYFTYRVGPFDNCSGCTGDMIRIVAVADQNDGPHRPTCLDPLDMLVSNELASMNFLISNNANLQCQLVPIRFTWLDCGDNTLSDEFGDSLYITNKLFDPIDANTYQEITDIGAGFPSQTGPPPSCDIGALAQPVRNLELFNGGIIIACNQNNSNRGDINVNGLPDEIADAVMYTQFFVTGLSAFLDHVPQSIAASDANADGLTLTVADLVYLIRVIVGDAPAIPKYDPGQPTTAELSLSGNTLSLENSAQRIGGMFLIIDGDISAELTDESYNMQIEYLFDGNQTRLLVFSQEGNSLPEQGDILRFNRDDVTIVSAELGSMNGEIVAARIGSLPKAFSLSQNYPNPFNPATSIRFALPERSEWTLEIYNTSGQLVTSWSGVDEAGIQEIEWDARLYASGVYLYRLVAGEFRETRKMVLLK